MSWQATNWATQQRVGDATRKLILLLLANRADEDGRCFPGQERLAQDAGVSVRTVRTHIQQLESDGYIVRDRRMHEGEGATGGRKTDLYHLQMDRGLPANPAGKSEGLPATDSMVTGKLLPVHIEPSAKNRKNNKTPKAELDASLDAFWGAYPNTKNSSKAEARVVWAALTPEERAAAMASMPKFREYCRANDWYRPLHVHRYLKTKRFEAWLPAEPSAPLVNKIKLDRTFHREQRRAWNEYRKSRGEPEMHREEWWFESEWPPGHEKHEGQDGQRQSEAA